LTSPFRTRVIPSITRKPSSMPQSSSTCRLNLIRALGSVIGIIQAIMLSDITTYPFGPSMITETSMTPNTWSFIWNILLIVARRPPSLSGFELPILVLSIGFAAMTITIKLWRSRSGRLRRNGGTYSLKKFPRAKKTSRANFHESSKF